MAAFKFTALALLLVVSLAAAQRKTTATPDDDETTAARTLPPLTSRKAPQPTLPPITKCKQAHCSHQCDDVPGKGAVCSCPDERMYLLNDGHTCRKKKCGTSNSKSVYKCGSGARCSYNWDFTERQMMPSCSCQSSFSVKMVFNSKSNSCERDQRYRTCEWPVKHSCSQSCKVVSKSFGVGTEPQCTCRSGYSLDSSGKKCVVSDPCRADGKNGGCDHRCSFNKRTLAVTCSCYGDGYSLSSDGKSCMVKSCKNGNSGCEQTCIQIDSKDYYCACDRGFHLNSDEKTCTDYDECAGFHGCDQLCVPDGNHYYTCACRSGYYLADNGFSCRVNQKCINHGCSQHCNPTTGACFCDSTHKLGPDGKTCIDIDECQEGTHNCAETCTNTDGGFACGCRDPKARLSNDLKTCILDTCQEVDDILYGSVSCRHGHDDIGTMKVGDYCSFTCNAGFKLIGATSIHCSRTGWDVTPPHCADIDECDDPLRCGANEECSNTAGSYNCFCLPGYNKENGKCVDRKGPQVLTCPKDANLKLPDDSNTVRFTWQKPTTFDPTDSSLSCSGCPDSEEKMLGVGDHTFRYLYSDKAGNRAICQFKAKVIDSTKPVFSGCPNNTVFTRGPGSYALEDFATVTATDNSGSVQVTTDKPDEFNKPGLRIINYVAVDGSGNQDSCTFSVNITVTDCKPLASPANGYHGCGDWHAGGYCQPSCDSGFAFNILKVDRYHCGSDGVWAPNKPLPDCFPIEQPEEASIKYIAKYRYSTCPSDDAATQKRIQEMVQGYFNQAPAVFCFIDNSCTLTGSPQISCKGNEFTVTIQTSEDYSKVQGHEDMVLEFKKKIRAQVSKQPAFMNIFIPPLTILSPLVDQNGLPLTPSFKLTCPIGSRAVYNQCVGCHKDDPNC